MTGSIIDFDQNVSGTQPSEHCGACNRLPMSEFADSRWNAGQLAA
jgi:hypothetical protein